jgi:TonB-linked SusC/RagA family outer membrane protein
MKNYESPLLLSDNRRKRMKICTFCICLFCSITLIGIQPVKAGTATLTIDQQSNRRIEGVISDEFGEPIIGANVVVKGTSNGTVTDLDGKFSLNVSNSDVLVITYISYITQEIPVGNQTSFSITLEEDTQNLDEVVVVGYGTTKRRNFTGSVSILNTAEGGVANTAPNNALDMLRGLTPGLSLSQSGVAGSTPSIQIRGQKSINSSSSNPLIVLNGVIFMGTLNDIDPAIVESMSVLKDATSLAAYGSQAANGVIMIATKKGDRGKPMIDFRGSVALVTPNYKPDILDGYQYIDRYNTVKNYQPGDVSWMSDLEKTNYEKGEQRDWFDYSTRTGVRQTYSLSVSGGTDDMDYMVSGSWMDNKNFIKSNDFIRKTVSARINTHINKYIRMGTNVNFATLENDGISPSVGRLYSPWGEPYLPDGSMRKYIVENTSDQLNPLWNTYNGIDQQVRNNSLTLGGEIEIRLPWIEGLSYKLTGNYTLTQNRTRRFTHETNLIQFTDGDDYSSTVTDKYLNLASGYIVNLRDPSYVYDNILTYTKDFGSHWVSATLVYTRDSQKHESINTYGEDFADLGNTTLGFYGLNNAKTQRINSIEYTLKNNVGSLGRINYSFNDTYHLNASVRRDGSSVFGADRKWGTFPAVGLAWTISNEEFFKKTIDWASNTKLKASWGENGNQSLDPYGTLSHMNVGKSGGVGNVYYFNGQPVFGQSLNTLGNPLLGWENTTSWNFGIESDFLKGRRLHVELDAYTSRTTDQIFSRQILSMGSGIPSQMATMGQIDNWGIEATITSHNIKTKDFNWNTSLMFSLNRNKLVELYGDGNDDITNQLFLGKSLGVIYSYKWAGVIQESDTQYMAANGGQPGDPMYENLDGSEDGKITPDDETILGYDKESFRMSLSNTLTYKSLSLYFLLNGTFSGGGYGKAQNNFAYGSQDGSMDYLNSNNHPWWTPENKSNKYVRPGFDVTNSDFIALQNYTFIRLQDINLSYILRNPWLKEIGIADIQLYVSGTNLFCFAPDWEFSDPEVRSSRDMQLARSYSFGVNFKF